MKETLLVALEAVITTLIPLLVAFLVVYLKKKSAEITAKVQNETAKTYIEEVTNAVATAVTATSQTYVDSLKKDGVFNAEAQKTALSKAKNTALSILSPAAADFIEKVYGDLDKYLVAKIEETVRVQKATIGTALFPVISETIEKTE